MVKNMLLTNKMELLAGEITLFNYWYNVYKIVISQKNIFYCIYSILLLSSVLYILIYNGKLQKLWNFFNEI